MKRITKSLFNYLSIPRFERQIITLGTFRIVVTQGTRVLIWFQVGSTQLELELDKNEVLWIKLNQYLRGGGGAMLGLFFRVICCLALNQGKLKNIIREKDGQNHTWRKSPIRASRVCCI